MRFCVLIGACALAFSGCRPPADAPVVLDFWAMGREGEVVAELMPEFEREHPGIRVEVQQLPWTSAHEKLLTAYAGRSTPDVCQLGNTWVPEMVALDALEPLGPYVRRSEVVRPDDYFPGIWATNVLDGTLWGVPWYVDTRVLFYRRDLLQRAGYDAVPETWAGWRDALRAIKRQGGEDRYGVLLPLNEFEPPLILGLQQPDSLLRDGGRYGNFQSPGFRRAFSFYLSLFEEGLAPAVDQTQVANVYQEMARGTFAFYITGPWNLGEFASRFPDSLQTAWATAPMPGPTGPGVSSAGGSSVVVFRQSRHKPEAWALVEYLSRPDVQARFYALTGDLPARRSAWAMGDLASNPRADAFREQLTRVRPAPPVPEQERIAQRLREVAEAAVRGRMTADEALATLDRDVDRMLEKRRWLLRRAGERENGGVGERKSANAPIPASSLSSSLPFPLSLFP